MVNVRQAYADAKGRLAAADLLNKNEINVLFRLAFGKTYPEVVADADATEEQIQKLNEFVERRVGGEPLQYICGKWVFLDFELLVGEGVLIPRDETEVITNEAIRLLKEKAYPTAVDLCSGTGCVAYAIKRAVPSCDVTAVELYDRAYRYLEMNREYLDCKVNLVQADVFGYESVLSDCSVDIIVSNPPYVTEAEYERNKAELVFEPPTAFKDGSDGLSFYRYFIPKYKSKLRVGGSMILETGNKQTVRVAHMFYKNGYNNIRILRDVYGNRRAVVAEK